MVWDEDVFSQGTQQHLSPGLNKLPLPTSTLVPLTTHSLDTNQRNLPKPKSDYSIPIPVISHCSKDKTLIPISPWAAVVRSLPPVQPRQSQPRQPLPLQTSFCSLSTLCSPLTLPLLKGFSQALPSVWNVLPPQFCLTNTHSSFRHQHDHCFFKETFTDLTRQVRSS